jgi:hypothetical protein
MKRTFKTFFAVAALAAVATISSCTKTCDIGYEGTDCKTEVRAKFVNEPNGYQVVEDGTLSAAANYTVHIQTSTTAINEVKITNVWNSFLHAVIAKVDGKNITIARQEPDGDKFFVEGSGLLSGNTISINYKVTDESDTAHIQTDAFGLGGGAASIWTKN